MFVASVGQSLVGESYVGLWMLVRPGFCHLNRQRPITVNKVNRC